MSPYLLAVYAGALLANASAQYVFESSDDPEHSVSSYAFESSDDPEHSLASFYNNAGDIERHSPEHFSLGETSDEQEHYAAGVDSGDPYVSTDEEIILGEMMGDDVEGVNLEESANSVYDSVLGVWIPLSTLQNNGEMMGEVLVAQHELPIEESIIGKAAVSPEDQKFVLSSGEAVAAAFEQKAVPPGEDIAPGVIEEPKNEYHGENVDAPVVERQMSATDAVEGNHPAYIPVITDDGREAPHEVTSAAGQSEMEGDLVVDTSNEEAAEIPVQSQALESNNIPEASDGAESHPGGVTSGEDQELDGIIGDVIGDFAKFGNSFFESGAAATGVFAKDMLNSDQRFEGPGGRGGSMYGGGMMPGMMGGRMGPGGMGMGPGGMGMGPGGMGMGPGMGRGMGPGMGRWLKDSDEMRNAQESSRAEPAESNREIRQGSGMVRDKTVEAPVDHPAAEVLESTDQDPAGILGGSSGILGSSGGIISSALRMLSGVMGMIF